MPFVAALSAHPLAAHAAGEVVGQALDQGAGSAHPVTTAVVLTSGTHGSHLGEIAKVVGATLGPSALIGATAVGVLGRGREVLDQPAVALWAGSVGARAVRIGPTGALVDQDGVVVEDGAAGGLVVLGLPSMPIDVACTAIRDRHPELGVVGGVLAAGVRPGDNQLLLGGRAVADGAVGLLVPPPDHPVALAAPGYRPIGVPLVVTAVDGPEVRELAGRAVLDRLDEVLLELDDAEAAAVEQGLHLGQVLDEHRTTFGPGDFTVHTVVAVDRDARTLSIAAGIELGATVQFLVRDAAGADLDLRHQLAGRHGAGALAFLSNLRGEPLFGEPDHDAVLIGAAVERDAVVGAFCSAVITPAVAAPLDHGPGAAVALFPEPGADR